MGVLLKSVIVWALATAFSRALVALGLGVFVYTGGRDFFDAAMTSVQSVVSGVSGDLYNLIGLFGIWDAMYIFASAGLAVVTVRTVRVFFGVAQ